MSKARLKALENALRSKIIVLDNYCGCGQCEDCKRINKAFETGDTTHLTEHEILALMGKW
ncbi:hypothetical protein [Vibrio agarivorans]|uniref:Uncharacterized protein n=1 Tax=Vibrio agarivorans TaxID=153622 RepID=A0ABT7Y0T3_9VIBR|nr:hypothetical protein [Vibrio agarivorans]MDN2481646.1 hypothetical protein [Vibrio agarivorans]